MKTYGFIFADEMEYAPFEKVALSRGGTKQTGKPLPMVTLPLDNAQVVAVQSGIGKVNASIAASLLIHACGVDAILNAGLSGAISHLRKGDVVAGATCVECDFDLTAFGLPRGKKSDGTFVHSADPTLLAAAESIAGIRSGALGTGDFFLNDRIRQFDHDLPTNGLVMVPASKVSLLKDTYTVNAPSARHYEFKEIYRSARRETEFKDTIYVFRFHKDSPTPARRGARLPPPNGEG